MAKGRLIGAGIAGAIGGGLNAALCFLRLPVPVHEPAATFRWHVIPAGVVHGCILAASAVALALLVGTRRWPFRIGAIVLAGWVTGYLSWIPLNMSVFEQPMLKSVVWPFTAGVSALWAPFFYFGIVGALLCLWLVWGQAPGSAKAAILAVSAAGIVGSLWWWVSWGPWYFSLIHGPIWGMPTGWALWRTEQKRA